MLLGICLGAAGFAVFLISHWVLFHCQVLKPQFKNLAAITLLSMLGVVLGCVGTDNLGLPAGFVGYPLVRGAAGIVTFACCWVLYMPFYYVIATSLSVQTLVLLEEAGPAGLPLTFLQRVFAHDVLDGRLETLAANGYLTKREGRYHVTSKAKCISQVFGWFKSIWRLGPGG